MPVNFPKRQTVKGIRNPLANAYEAAADSGHGVSSGAHPEFEAETPGEAVARNVRKVVNFGRGMAAKIKTGITGKK